MFWHRRVWEPSCDLILRFNKNYPQNEKKNGLLGWGTRWPGEYLAPLLERWINGFWFARNWRSRRPSSTPHTGIISAPPIPLYINGCEFAFRCDVFTNNVSFRSILSLVSKHLLLPVCAPLCPLCLCRLSKCVQSVVVPCSVFCRCFAQSEYGRRDTHKTKKEEEKYEENKK